MALNPIALNLRGDTRAAHVAPVSLSSPWQVCIAAGGVNATRDAARITDPTAEIITATRRIIKRETLVGTYLLFRLKYDDGISVPTAPQIAVFGRFASGDNWQRLLNKSGTDVATLTPDTTNDVSDGTDNWTAVGDGQTFDCLGCDEFLVGTEIAFAATGTVSNSVIEVKCI